MKTSGPDHPIALEPAAGRWQARFQGQVIADSSAAVILREAGYPPRVYFPRADVAMQHLQRSEASTHCPYKGDAAYYTVRANGRMSESAVWTYEQPYPAMAGIEALLSFYPDRIEVYKTEESVAAPRGDTQTHVSPDASVDSSDDGGLS